MSIFYDTVLEDYDDVDYNAEDYDTMRMKRLHYTANVPLYLLSNYDTTEEEYFNEQF